MAIPRPGEDNAAGVGDSGGIATGEVLNFDERLASRYCLPWQPTELRGLGADLAENAEEPEDLICDDGRGLLYCERVNAIVGAPEVGKTRLADFAEIQAHRSGFGSLRFDFDGSARDYVRHLVEHGMDEEMVLRRGRYWRFDEPLDYTARHRLFRQLEGLESELIVVDGLTRAMALHDLDGSRNEDVLRFWRDWLRPLQKLTAGSVLVLDHTGKDGSWLGGMQKLALVDGACLRADVVRHLARGCAGELRLVLEKDRPGALRPRALPDGEVARFRLASRDDGFVTMSELVASAPDASQAPRTQLDLMVAFLSEGPRSAADVAGALGISAGHVRALLAKDGGQRVRRNGAGLVELVR